MLPKTKLRELSHPIPDHEYCTRHCCNRIFWNEISNRHDLTEDFIREFADNINWRVLSGSENLVLSDEFLEEFSDKIVWPWISSYKRLELRDLRRWKNKLYWEGICRNQKLSEEAIREFSDRMKWDIISASQKLSEKLMEDVLNFLDISSIARRQKLSEAFIEKHWDVFKPYINFIARHQKLSAPFVWKHIDVLDIDAMAKNSKINMNLREKFQYLVRTKAVLPWNEYWFYNDNKENNPLRENHNLQNKKVVEWLNLEVQ